ncbi:zinc ABC transporter substrate-binding protein [bacterium]|nr:zinc ABC transporter substrate-binding protein [bacterium]MBU1675232.1 zinc ABC transporter substrate-binding protein [bacterium]
MRKYMTLMIAAALVPVLLAGTPAQAKKLNVVTTLTDLASIARSVGGEDVTVISLCPGTRDPHFMPAKPSLARKLGKADMLVYDGMELEIGWLPQLIEKARNPRVKPGARGDVDCSQAISNLLEVPAATVDRSEGDIHPLGNPHYTLDPRNAEAVADLLAERMSDLDPVHAQAFADRAAAFKAEIEKHLPGWVEMTAKARAHHVLIYHKHWTYLVDWLGLDKIGEIEHRPGITPSPRHVHEMMDKAKRLGDVVIIAATWDHLDAAKEVGKRSGAPLVVLPGHTGGTDGTDDYISFIDTICRSLAAATTQLQSLR